MKKFIPLVLLAVMAICGVFFFLFYRMGTHDTKAIADFTAAYDDFDKAVSDYSIVVFEVNRENPPSSVGLEQRTVTSLAELNTKVSVRISSLTKNDGELMKVSAEIADLAKQEVDALQAYHCAAASKSGDVNQLAQRVLNLMKQRQADYATYLELAGKNNGDS